MERKISLAAGLLAACLACGCGEGNSISPGGLAQDRATQGSESRRVHEDFQQLLPRGGIPAIDDPKYVSADQAKISDDAFVFGVVIEGQPFAYSLNLLNGHEVVNDTFGKTNFAAVWWPLANTAVVYDRTYQGKALNFEASGGLTNASLVMQDKQTDTYWSLMKGQALSGELEGEKLRELPVGEKVTWKVWRARHPNTKVLSVNSQEDGRNPYQNYFADSTGFRGLKAKDDRLKTKTPIFAFHHAGKPFAVAFDSIDSGATFKLPDGNHVFLYRTANDELFRSTAAFISNEPFVRTDQGWSSANGTDMFDGISRTFNDSTITPLNGFDTFWYNWSLNNPGTELLTK